MSVNCTEALSGPNESSSIPFEQQHCSTSPSIGEVGGDPQSSSKDQHTTSPPPVDAENVVIPGADALSDLNESSSMPFQPQHNPTNTPVDKAGGDSQSSLKDQLIISPPPVDFEKVIVLGADALSDLNESSSVPLEQQSCSTSPPIGNAGEPETGLKHQHVASPPPVDPEKVMIPGVEALSGLNESSSILFEQQHCPRSPPIDKAGEYETGSEEQHASSPPPVDAEKVILPDLFVSFLSQKTRLNPNYELVKLESEAWMKQTCKWTEKEHEKRARADFSYFGCEWVPDVGPEECRVVCDWLNWVFEFDDQFDEGEFGENPEVLSEEVKVLIEIMESPNAVIYTAAHHPLRYVFQSVWQRVSERSSGAPRRFIKAMKAYLSGVIHQVELQSSADKVDIDTFFAFHRDAIGVHPCLALMEYAYALDIPDELFEHHSIRKIEILATEIVTLQNDILSFHKEQSMGVNHNIIHHFRQDGLSQQEAYEKANLLLHERYRAWYVAHSEIPIWGEKIDAQVMLYVQGCMNVLLANINWGLKSHRYFGKESAVVRETRMVSLLP